MSFLNHEFILSFLDNANILGNAIAAASTEAQLVSSLGAEEKTAINYLLINCNLTKSQMMAHSSDLEKSMASSLGQFQRTELLLMLGGLGLVIVVTVLKLIAVCRINK